MRKEGNRAMICKFKISEELAMVLGYFGFSDGAIRFYEKYSRSNSGILQMPFSKRRENEVLSLLAECLDYHAFTTKQITAKGLIIVQIEQIQKQGQTDHTFPWQIQ